MKFLVIAFFSFVFVGSVYITGKVLNNTQSDVKIDVKTEYQQMLIDTKGL